MFTLVMKGPEQFETAKVEIQVTNDTMASIGGGIQNDDVVVLNLHH